MATTKAALKCNSPKRTPGHPKKSHVVKACEGGKEKLIRELFINDDLIEAIISLPPGLFYGTGIPACVLVCNKNKPDELRNKILFINADREYAEGKNQNKLRRTTKPTWCS